MKALVCELCGSNDIVKMDGVFVCQHCGTKYSLEEAKKLLGTVQIDRSEEIRNTIIVGMRAYQNDDFANAARYFETVMLADANDWKAYIYHATSVFCCAQPVNIPDAAERYKQAINTAIRIIMSRGLNNDALREVYCCVVKATWSQANKLRPIASRDGNNSFHELYTYLYRVYNFIENRFVEVNVDQSIIIQEKKGKVYFLESYREFFSSEAEHIISSLIKEIRKYDKEYKADKKKFLWFN